MREPKAIVLLVVLLLSMLIATAPAVYAGEGGHDAAGEARAHTHEVDPVTEALISGLMSGGLAFVYITLAAMLPLLWVFTLIVHFARPYILRYLKKYTLRFGADVWWLVYVMIRDAVMILTFVLSIFFFFPDLFLLLPLPVTAPLATVFLFWALLVKLTRDGDDRAGDFRSISYLLLLGAVVYLVPFLFGVEAPMEGWEHWRTLFTSSQNQGMAEIILYLSLALLFITGGYIFTFVMRYVRQSSRQVSGEPPATRSAAPPFGN